MTELEKAQIRMGCVIEATKLKQNSNLNKENEGKSVAEIAKELAAFVLVG